MTVDGIIQFGRTYLRTPYHHQGRVRGVGVDCAGLAVGLARACGVQFEDIPHYGRFGRGVNLPNHLGKWLKPIPVEQAGPGDIMAFWITTSGWVCHCGMLTDKGVLHTHSGVGFVVEHRMDDYWMKRQACAFQLPLERSWQH